MICPTLKLVPYFLYKSYVHVYKELLDSRKHPTQIFHGHLATSNYTLTTKHAMTTSKCTPKQHQLCELRNMLIYSKRNRG